MGFIISLAFTVIGALILYWIIRSAVRGGVEAALRNHHQWLQAVGHINGHPSTDTKG